MSPRVAFLLGLVFLTPLFAFGQSLLPLVPCEGVGNQSCQACHVVELAQRIINFLVVVATLIAVGMFAYAGLLMVTNNGESSKISHAKGIFTTVAVGFIILLAGWLIIDTVMKMLYEGSALDQSTRSSFGPWNQIECVVVDPSAYARSGTGTSTGVGVASGDESGVRATLAAAGVSVNKSACPEGISFQIVVGGCTSVGGLNDTTINNIVAIKEGCNCEVVVTGGNELGHSGSGAGTHAGGDKVDFRPNPTLNAYITSGQSGMTCVREDIGTSNDHWDCKN